MARRKNTRFIDPRYFMDEKMERLGEGQIPDHPPSEDPRLVDRMKYLYSKVIEMRPEFELGNSIAGPPESVDLFIKAYELAGQQGMSNVHKIIRKMEELSRSGRTYVEE